MPEVTKPNADRCAYVINPRDGVVCGFPADNHMKHHAFVPPNAPEATLQERLRMYAACEFVSFSEQDESVTEEALAAMREAADALDAKAAKSVEDNGRILDLEVRCEELEHRCESAEDIAARHVEHYQPQIDALVAAEGEIERLRAQRDAVLRYCDRLESTNKPTLHSDNVAITLRSILEGDNA